MTSLRSFVVTAVLAIATFTSASAASMIFPEGEKIVVAEIEAYYSAGEIPQEVAKATKNFLNAKSDFAAAVRRGNLDEATSAFFKAKDAKTDLDEVLRWMQISSAKAEALQQSLTKLMGVREYVLPSFVSRKAAEFYTFTVTVGRNVLDREKDIRAMREEGVARFRIVLY